ncbi:hypothetical protein E1B28_010031 [Marasmius oreades]|uniref:Vps72/YL1 C-terminal domain-containing protein n=1 Tax=Marasmius oreades TaxID=181124 RepID=A0A9P7UR29_9AGAR|nr:uncharacterized protein E1B28_010031 [Marasmius oreades]KAG7090963.1 hypothetical protein E1B28_010031 [Marasmius oreades]
MDEPESNVEGSLVSRRSRRSTAGNRMQAVMAEMSVEDPDPEDDQDFAVDKFEEDIFGSDFESTDEEEAQLEAESGEKEVQDEEREARKSARSRVEKATAAAHARQKMTFNPTASISQSASKPKAKLRRQVTISVNPDTGEVTMDDIARLSQKRQSKRTHTIKNSSATIKRLLETEQQKALQIPKKSKGETRALTQGELIARALDNEEGNIVEHRDYLKSEEEKRRRARVVRENISGPLVRFISKGEVKVREIPAPLPSPPSAQPANPGGAYTYGFSQTPASGFSTYGQHTSSATTSYYRTPVSGSASITPSSNLNLPVLELATSALSTMNNQTIPTDNSSQLEHIPEQCTVKVTKNLVIHELGQHDKVSKPQWSETMEALFGDHVRWEDVKVYSGKSRPLSRIRQTCPITGLQAKYLDPRTGIPFADVRAYKVITGLLSHSYVWCPELGCYTRTSPEVQETTTESMNSS